MTDAHKQPHDRNIVQKEKNQRLIKVKEHEFIFQEHIAADFPLYKGENAIDSERRGHNPK